ncbi:MAG: hypothetical protein AAGG38_02090 [Planctomycetota bacterium]
MSQLHADVLDRRGDIHRDALVLYTVVKGSPQIAPGDVDTSGEPIPGGHDSPVVLDVVDAATDDTILGTIEDAELERLEGLILEDHRISHEAHAHPA